MELRRRRRVCDRIGSHSLCLFADTQSGFLSNVMQPGQAVAYEPGDLDDAEGKTV
jgi:hypothetical protein